MRYIDADAAINLAKEEIDDGTPNDIAWKLEALPTVDAVEVVRCKDCKHIAEFYDIERNVLYWKVCKYWGGATDSDGFCYEAERRTDERLNQQTGCD